MGFELISAILLLNVVNPGSLTVHLCELVCQLSDSNVKQSLSGTAAGTLSVCCTHVPIEAGTAWKWSCFTHYLLNTLVYFLVFLVYFNRNYFLSKTLRGITGLMQSAAT